jgi:DNA-3-methyladenine glycosylase I
VARFDRRKVRALLANPGIVRNRMKVESAIANARAFLEIQDELGGFDSFVWGFVGGVPKVNAWKSPREVPASTAESKAMSRELVRRGMRFVGPTICYAFMQAVGLVNDHTTDCAWYPGKARRRARPR